MTATPARQRRKPPPAEPPQVDYPVCAGCGRYLYEDLLGRLRCLWHLCDRRGQQQGTVEGVDVGCLADALTGEPEP